MKMWMKYIFWLGVAIGIFLRFYNLRYTTEFTFDQEHYLAFPAKQILIDHHLTAIGAKTGVGDLFVGPLYTYLGALFFWLFRMDPVAGVYLSAVLASLTLVAAYLLIKKTHNSYTALIFIAFWSISPFVLVFDRTPININLLSLSTLFTVSGLQLSLKRKTWWGGILVGLGFFLGINSHFTSVFLIFGALIILGVNRKTIGMISFLFSLLGLVFGFLPLAVFDFKHGFLITHNLMKFIFESSGGSLFPVRLWHIGLTIGETIGRLFLYDGPQWLQQSLGICIVALLVHASRKWSKSSKHLVVFLLVYWVGFSLYKGSTPDYYFLGLLIIVCLEIAFWVAGLLNQKNYFLGILIIALILLWQGWSKIHQPLPKSLGVKQEIVKAVKNRADDTPIVLKYDIEYGWQEGFEYLLYYYGLHLSDDASSLYLVSFPSNRFPGKPDITIGDMAVGYPETVAKILSTKEVRLYNVLSTRIPKNWSILSCPYVDFDTYLLTPDASASCSRLASIREGFIVAHLPECSIWEMSGVKGLDLGIRSSFPLIKVAASKVHYAPVSSDFQLIATAFERQRCFVFADLKKPQLEPLSDEMLDLISSLKQVH